MTYFSTYLMTFLMPTLVPTQVIILVPTKVKILVSTLKYLKQVKFRTYLFQEATYFNIM